MRAALVVLGLGAILGAGIWAAHQPIPPRTNAINEALLAETRESLRRWQEEWGPPVIQSPFPPTDGGLIQLPESELEGPGVIPAPTPPEFLEMENLPPLEASTSRN